MNAATKLVWTGHWPLVAGLDIWTRVFSSRPHRYFIVLDYPPVEVPGALGLPPSQRISLGALAFGVGLFAALSRWGTPVTRGDGGRLPGS